MNNLISWVELKNNDLVIFLSILVTISAIVLIYQWYLNKKKFNQLDHDISADVVRRYLDSVIRNTEALKGSLFRGDVPVEAAELKVTSAGGGADNSQFIAEIAKLKSTLEAREKELAAARAAGGSAEGGASSEELSKVQAELETLKAQNTELEEKLKDAASAGGGESAGYDQKATQLQAELDEIKKEKDVLKERLQEYEIIEDDLANLKRLQQENEQLKKSLEGGAVPEPVVEAKTAEVNVPEKEAVAAAPAPKPAEPPKPKTEKVSLAKPTDEEDPDDLLKEFEKMLG